jgi:hypothetical protein
MLVSFSDASLWDLVMEEFNARQFLELWTPVIGWHVARRNLVAYGVEGHTEDHILRVGEGDVFYGKIKALADFLRDHDLELSTARADVILSKMTAGVHMSELEQDIGNLNGRIRDELERRTLLIMPSTKRDLWRQTIPLFGEDVFEKFKDADYDIAEAGKCLALERSTAVVFHLMRAMESAVKALGEKLGATVSSASGEILSWGVIVANIKPKIDSLPKGKGQDEWLKLYAMLHSVNRAFRTKTAHPVNKYTQEEAENAFCATRVFMQEMAEILSAD